VISGSFAPEKDRAVEVDEAFRLIDAIDDTLARKVLAASISPEVFSTLDDINAGRREIEGIELDSPGGSAAEGFALAALVRDRGLDTFVRADCASACVLVFAGGRERLAAPSARFGLHRSGVTWQRGDRGVSATDLAMERFFRERGVTDGFIARALETPFHEIWVPPVDAVMGSGLGTGLWRGLDS